MADKPLSEAWAELHLSTDTWESDLRVAQRKLVTIAKQIEAATKVEISATLDTSKTRLQIEAELRKLRTSGITIPVTADMKPAQAAATAFATGVAGLNPSLTVDADTGVAQAKVEELTAGLSAFESIIVQVEVRDEQIREAEESLLKLGTLAASVNSADIVIDPEVRDAAVKAELVKLSALIEAVTGQPANIDVSLDAASLFATFAKIQAAVQALGENRIDLKLNTGDALAEMAEVQAGLAAFKNITVQLDVRTAQIEEARAALERLAVLVKTVGNEQLVIDPELRDAGIRSELGQLSVLIESLTGEPANIRIDLDGATFTAEQLAVIQKQVEALDGRKIDIDARLNSAGVVAGIAEIDAAADHTTDPKRGGLGRMATIIGFMGIGGVVAIGAAGAAITAFGVQSAASLEATQKSFENILGSADKANELFKELQAFAIPSPFDTQVLADTTKSLLAIGVSAEEVIPTVKDLGAIVALLAGGSNEAFGRLTLALGQIRSAVKPLTQDLRQITSAIPGFNTEMQLAQGVAAKFGINVREAQEKIKDGAISGEEAFGIILERMREFPGVAGAIEAAADTLGGKLSAFKDTIKVNLVEAFTGVTGQIEDLLGPLQTVVEGVLPKIAGALGRSLANLIPNIPKLVESLGTGLAPAFEGIFTGLGGAIEGLTPVIEKLLPVLGELGPIVGEILAKLGPVAAEAGTSIANVLVPALSILADVLDAIPTPVLSTLVEAFLAFKAIQGVSRIFDTISLSLGRMATPTLGAGQGMNLLSKAATGLQSVMSIAGPAIAGAFAGIALASDDAATQMTGAAGAVAAIGTGFAVGGLPGGAIATAGVALGGLIGKFQEAQAEAKKTEEAVKSLADTIIRELDPGRFTPITFEGIFDTAGVQSFIQDQIAADDGLRKSLLDLSLGVVDLGSHLGDNKQDFATWIQGIGNAKLAAAGFKNVTTELDGSTLKIRNTGHATAEEMAAAQHAIVDLQPDIKEITNQYEIFAGAIADANEQFRLNALAFDSFDAANAFETRAAGVSGQLDKITLAAIASAEHIRELQSIPNRGLFDDALDSANLFEQRLAGLGEAEDAHAAHMQALADAFQVEFQQAQDAVAGLNDELRSLQGLLSADIASQNFNASLQSFQQAITSITNQDQIDKGLALNEQINAQRNRILDAQERLATAQQKVDLDAADLQDQIEQANKVGAFNRAAELQKRLSRLGDDTADERRALQDEIDKLKELQGELNSIDLTPRRLIDQVRAQAQASGLSLADFLKGGTTPEAIQVQQSLIAPLISSALNQIQGELETGGVEAAATLAKSLEAGLIATFTPAFGVDTAEQIVDTYLPQDEWFKAGQQAAQQAKEAAIAEFLATGQIPLSVKLDAQTQDMIDTIKLLQKKGLPPIVQTVLTQINAGTITPDQIERFQKQFEDQGLLPVGLKLTDIQDTLDTIEGLDPKVLASLGLGDTEDLLTGVENLKPEVTVGVQADTTAVEAALRLVEQHPITVTLLPALPTAAQLANLGAAFFGPNFIPPATFPQRAGGIWELGSHRVGRETVAPLVRYGEPETHGEVVFVPEHGDRSRTERLLRYVADKLSYDLTPRAPHVSVSPVVHADLPAVRVYARSEAPRVHVDAPSMGGVEKLLRAILTRLSARVAAPPIMTRPGSGLIQWITTNLYPSPTDSGVTVQGRNLHDAFGMTRRVAPGARPPSVEQLRVRKPGPGMWWAAALPDPLAAGSPSGLRGIQPSVIPPATIVLSLPDGLGTVHIAGPDRRPNVGHIPSPVVALQRHLVTDLERRTVEQRLEVRRLVHEMRRDEETILHARQYLPLTPQLRAGYVQVLAPRGPATEVHLAPTLMPPHIPAPHVHLTMPNLRVAAPPVFVNPRVIAPPVFVTVPAVATRSDTPRVHVTVPSASARQFDDAALERMVRTAVREAVAARSRPTQADFDSKVIVERIEQLIIGEDPRRPGGGRRAAFDFIDAMKSHAQGF